MRKYQIRPKGALIKSWDFDDYEPMRLNLSVYEPLDECRETGLMDQYENPIFMYVEKDRIGFINR